MTVHGAAAQFRCATCDIELERPGFFYLGLAFCCPGCAADGPCTCSYDEPGARQVAATATRWPARERRALQCTEPPDTTVEDGVDGLSLPFTPRVAAVPAIAPAAVAPARTPARPAASANAAASRAPELARAAAD